MTKPSFVIANPLKSGVLAFGTQDTRARLPGKGGYPHVKTDKTDTTNKYNNLEIGFGIWGGGFGILAPQAHVTRVARQRA